MSFIETRSDIQICGKALSRIKQQPLSGALDDPVNQNKHAGRECLLWYKTIVREVLTAHHWGLATKRVALVSAPTNPRPAEWAAAYLPPADMAFPVMVGPYSDVAGVSYYRGVGFLLASLYGRPVFRFEGAIIFAAIEGATLDYVSFDLTEQDFNEAVEKLVVLFLASQFARSIAKDDKLAKELHQEGVSEMNLEIARNLNMSQPRYGQFISESEMARGGLDPVLAQYPGFTL